MSLEFIQHYYFLFLMCQPRMFTALGFILSRGFFPGAFTRNGVMIGLSLFIYPIVDNHFTAFTRISLERMIGIGLKEVIIGFLIGFFCRIPFWAFVNVGRLVDNQRGASLMDSLKGQSDGDEASTLSDLFGNTMVALFMMSGGFILFFRALVASYNAWPIGEFYPKLSPEMAEYAIMQFQWLMEMLVLFSFPIIIALFLSEFGLALISRFAPQLNVFILSMSVKSAVAIAFLTVYFGFLMRQFTQISLTLDKTLLKVMGIIQ